MDWKAHVDTHVLPVNDADCSHPEYLSVDPPALLDRCDFSVRGYFKSWFSFTGAPQEGCFQRTA